MFEEFDARTKTKVIRTSDGTARLLSHTDKYVATKSQNPKSRSIRVFGPLWPFAGSAA